MRSHILSTVARMWVLAAVALLASGCGNKGPLRLPASPPVAKPSTSPSPVLPQGDAPASLPVDTPPQSDVTPRR